MFGLITDLIPVFLLGSLGIGKRCFGSRNNSTNSNPFASGLLLSRESSKVSFGLPAGFSVTAENGSSKVCFELLETFRVTPKTLLPTAYPPKSISLFLTFDAQSSFLFVPLQDKILIKWEEFWDCLLSFQGLPKRLSPDLLCSRRKTTWQILSIDLVEWQILIIFALKLILLCFSKTN